MGQLDKTRPALADLGLGLWHLEGLLLVSVLVAVCASTLLVRTASSAPASAPSSELRKPLQPPSWLPYIGHASWFLNPTPGAIWRRLSRFDSRAEAFTLAAFGHRIHVVRIIPRGNKFLMLSPNNRGRLLARAGKNIFGLEAADHANLVAHHDELKQVFASHLLKRSCASDLTRRFWTCMQHGLGKQRFGTSGRVSLSAWTYDVVFDATATTFFGQSPVESYLEIKDDLLVVEKNLMLLYLGLPRFLTPGAYRARERLLEKLGRLGAQMQSDDSFDSDQACRDSRLGSRIVVEQRAWCRKHGFSRRGVAAMECGFLFALGTNATPAISWMLMHILAPRGDETLLPRIMDELVSAQSDDGSVDMARLMTLPLLQAVYAEVLRLYTDLVILGQIDNQETLTLGDARPLVLDKGMVLYPVWFPHRESSNYSHPPPDEFCAARFLREDPASGKTSFDAHAARHLFPYGHGSSSCPGRTFAKQEMLAAVASILLTFDMDFVRFLDAKGRPSPTFPRPAARYNISSGVLAVGGEMEVNVRRRQCTPSLFTPSVASIPPVTPAYPGSGDAYP